MFYVVGLNLYSQTWCVDLKTSKVSYQKRHFWGTRFHVYSLQCCTVP